LQRQTKRRSFFGAERDGLRPSAGSCASAAPQSCVAKSAAIIEPGVRCIANALLINVSGPDRSAKL
jgi:hypothetical protein